MIEFGIIALLFTFIMFAVIDFGLLFNDWLAVSSGTRALARDASLGISWADLQVEAGQIQMPGVSGNPPFQGYCCKPASPGNAGDAVVLTVVIYDQCTPGVTNPNTGAPCAALNMSDRSVLDSRFSSDGVTGTCTTWSDPTPTPCAHPAPPGPPAPVPGNCGHQFCPGDTMQVSLTAMGAQVITPLVRPLFARQGLCPYDSSPSHCFVPLSSSLTMRFEGDVL
jgi:hypothetical protein